ncbi:hypothetical protein MKW92_027942 [Papaver armeniacum]|nr:hypothetical protein MKW92_027942 [Papaver armeniacum]
MVTTPNGMAEEDEEIGVSSLDFGSSEALKQVRKLTDVGCMTRLLHEFIAYQRNLDLELENHLCQRTDLEKKLKKNAEVLDFVKFEADSMLLNVKSTCDLADQVSGKRGNCIEGAKKAIEIEDYESAAKFVQTFLEIDEKFSDSDGGSDDQRQQILDSKKKLEGIVRKKLTSAVDQRDHSTIKRFIMLFPLLGLEEEGLQVYVNYLKKVISVSSRLAYENLVEQIDQSYFVECLTSLFGDIVFAVEENDGILRNLCGEDGIVYAIIELQEECDSWGSLVLRKYMEFRKLSRVESEIISYSKNMLSVGTVEGPDPREVELYLEEILALIELREQYTGFMVSKIRELRSVDPELGPRATKAFRNGSFSKVVQEITGFYVILEEFFMVENVRKAIKIDEHVPDSLTTCMVDDVFYVLKSSCTRAIRTSSMNSLLAILSGAMNLLSNEYQEALQHKIGEPNLGAKLFLGGVGVQKTGTEIATALNNMDVSGEYVLKLQNDKKIKSCLSELGEMSTGFKQTLNAGMEHLVSTVTPRIRPVLDIVQKLLHAVETNATWLQPTMTSSNYDSFVHLIIDFIVKRLEVTMMQKKFSQLGGLQLDRDARALVSHFSGMTQRTVRDKFARLTQMATILNLEKNAGPMTWRLTPAEVRRVLGLRIDFRPEAIAALRL